jgi:pyrimidine operon attenuation protein / uracil phosphoribosyltransferase
MDDSRAHLDLSRIVLSSPDFDGVIESLTEHLVQSCIPLTDLALVGIRSRGVPLAQRLAAAIKRLAGVEVEVGALDITLYRDDVFQGMAIPEVGITELPFEVEGRSIVLVDDVFYTGRTVRAALDALMDFGRPKWIRLLVLVDRGRHELPIRPDYCGLSLDTEQNESVEVRIREFDLEDRIAVFRRKDGQ